jgi:citrate synthase
VVSNWVQNVAFDSDETPPKGRALPSDTLTIVDNRTGKEYTVPIVDGAIRATDLRQITAGENKAGLLSFDPAYLNTASCRSAITYIDGGAGILRYRGYPIEEVAEAASFLETSYLLLEGELPTADALQRWEDDVRSHTYVHTNVTKFLEGFRYDAHPMGMLLGAVGALSTFYPDAKNISDPQNRYLQRVRLIAKLPTIAAYIFRHSHGLPYVLPRNDLGYIGNYVNMTFEIGGRYEANPVLQRALETLLILHADHEQNCSTSAVRSVGSSHVDPFSAVSAGIAALYGPLHGGANEAVLEMLDQISDKANVPKFVEQVKAGKGRLMGFGHRVYKSYDPRAKLIKQVADSVFTETGLNPKLEIALELERIALEDEYFVSRKLYPNVDFYSGLIYQAMGYPTDYFTVLFALGRLPGWIAQWEEMLTDPEQKIARPRQIYTGAKKRAFVPRAQR